MTAQFPALLIIVPLLVACLIALTGWAKRWLCHPLTVAALSVSALSSLGLLYQVFKNGQLVYKLGGWAPPWGISYNIDYLNAPVLVVVAFAALLNLIAGYKVIEEEQGEKAFIFYALYLLAVTGLLGIVVTGDAFNLYVLLEIAALSGYALVARGNSRAVISTFNYLILGTIGASFYLLGIGFLYILTGSLNMTDIANILPGLYHSKAVFAAFVVIMVGVWLKAAFFPLHSWLPNAYTNANTAAAGLLAPLATKVMIYVMVRMMLTVFTPAFVFQEAGGADFVVYMASAAILAGAALALSERSLKRMLTYIIITEVGYMVGGAWLGNRLGMTGAILHVLNDAVMTLCVFMAAANIAYRKKGHSFDELKDLFARMPFTMTGLVIGALSIIGVPPTCGFYSKWYLLLGALQAGHYTFLAALLISSLVSLILFFRIFEIAYFGDLSAAGHGHGPASGHRHSAVTVREAPAVMVAPLLLVASAIILMGLMTGSIVNVFITPAIPKALI